MKVVKSTTARAPPPLSFATPPLAHCSDRGHYGSEEEGRRYLAQQMSPPPPSVMKAPVRQFHGAPPEWSNGCG